MNFLCPGSSVDTCPTCPLSCSQRVGQGGEQRFPKKEMDKYFVYILKSKIKEVTYVGFTNNLDRRIKEHNLDKSKFTNIYKPWELVYSEEYDSEEEAIQREKYFKTAAGRRLIRKLLGRN